MKIKKIIDICKKSGVFILFQASGQQWISDGFGAYPMIDMPNLNADLLCTMYDIPEKSSEKMVFRRQDENTFLDLSDGVEDEVFIERERISIKYSGKWLIPLKTSQGMMFIDSKYLTPFADMDDSTFGLYERHASDGHTFFVAKSGFLIVGAIMPFNVINADFVDCLKKLSQQCEVAYFNKKSHDNIEVQEKIFENHQEM